MYKHQSRPKQIPIVLTLLKTGLFNKVGTKFRINTLRLINTDYYLFISDKFQLNWYYIPPGAVAIDDCSFYQARAVSAIDNVPKIKKILLKDVLDGINLDVKEKLIYHLNLANEVKNDRF